MKKNWAPMVFTVLITALILSACTVYQSTDRESFNNNALSGAPAFTLASDPVCQNFENIEDVNELGLNLSDKNEDYSYVNENDSTARLQFAQRHELPQATVCALTLEIKNPSTLDLEALLETARSIASDFAVNGSLKNQ